MALLDFIRRADAAQLRWMLAYTMLAGVANAALVVVITRVAGMVSRGEPPSPLAWGVFGGVFALYYAANQVALVRAMKIIETLLTSQRVEIADMLRKSDLLTVDGLGRGRLFSLVAAETNHLSVTFPLIMQGFQQTILLFVSLAYLGWLSPFALLVFVGTITLGLVAYRMINAQFEGLLARVSVKQQRIMDAIADIMRGAKEMRLSPRQGDAVLAAYWDRSQQLERLLVRSVEHWVVLVLLGSVATFGMLGGIVFVFPDLASGQRAVIFQLIPVLLFCMGTLTGTLAQSPMFLRAETGLQALMAIRHDLSQGPQVTPDEARSSAAVFDGFKHLTLNAGRFSYDPTSPDHYSVGPLGLAASAGEVVFLVGGNGSGKSTVLRLITGLYPLRSGWLSVDDTTVTRQTLAGYRELFSTVFTDFHLFDRLYGLEGVAPERVYHLLEELGLASIVSFEDGSFDKLQLSTGQRKRLALIAALLEDRPIYVFDEWAAEQDVSFRAYFYKTIIPNLRAQGKLVIATSHDESFWSVADRVIKLDLGVVEWVRPGTDFVDKSQ